MTTVPRFELCHICGLLRLLNRCDLSAPRMTQGGSPTWHVSTNLCFPDVVTSFRSWLLLFLSQLNNLTALEYFSLV